LSHFVDAACQTTVECRLSELPLPHDEFSCCNSVSCDHVTPLCSTVCQSAANDNDELHSSEHTSNFNDHAEFLSSISQSASDRQTGLDGDINQPGGDNIARVRSGLQPPPSCRVDVRSESAVTSRVVKNVTVTNDSAATSSRDSDFPSLEVAVGIHQRKHSPPLVLKVPRKSRGRRRRSVDDFDMSEERSSPPGIYAKVIGDGLPAEVCQADSCGQDSICDGNMWTTLPMKENNRSLTDSRSRRRSIDDNDRTSTVLGSSCSGKHMTSMSMVLAEFLAEDQVPENCDEPSMSDNDCTDFAPLLVCTNCGERTHTIRTCQRNLGALFCDAE
jgi:hypothetical protein